LSELRTLGKKSRGKKIRVVFRQNSSNIIPGYRDIPKEHTVTGINLNAKYAQPELGKRNGIY